MSWYFFVLNETFSCQYFMSVFQGQKCCTFWKWNSFKVSQEVIWDQSSFLNVFILIITFTVMIQLPVFGPIYLCFITSYLSPHFTAVSVKNADPATDSWAFGSRRAQRMLTHIAVHPIFTGLVMVLVVPAGPAQAPHWPCPQGAQWVWEQCSHHTVCTTKGWTCGTLISVHSMDTLQKWLHYHF